MKTEILASVCSPSFIWVNLKVSGAYQVVLVVKKEKKKKRPSASAGKVRDTVQSLGRKDPLEEEMATHSSILA